MFRAHEHETKEINAGDSGANELELFITPAAELKKKLPK